MLQDKKHVRLEDINVFIDFHVLSVIIGDYSQVFRNITFPQIVKKELFLPLCNTSSLFRDIVNV